MTPTLTVLAHIYQEIKATDMKYKNRVRSRISNLKDPKNPGLRKNVLAGSIDLNRIATMSAEVRDVVQLHSHFFMVMFLSCPSLSFLVCKGNGQR